MFHPTQPNVLVHDPLGSDRDREFSFDAVLTEGDDNETTFAVTTGPVVDSLLAGHNCAVVLYGQPGSGRMHTLVGRAGAGRDDESRSGLIDRALEAIFAKGAFGAAPDALQGGGGSGNGGGGAGTAGSGGGGGGGSASAQRRGVFVSIFQVGASDVVDIVKHAGGSRRSRRTPSASSRDAEASTPGFPDVFSANDHRTSTHRPGSPAAITASAAAAVAGAALRGTNPTASVPNIGVSSGAGVSGTHGGRSSRRGSESGRHRAVRAGSIPVLTRPPSTFSLMAPDASQLFAPRRANVVEKPDGAMYIFEQGIFRVVNTTEAAVVTEMVRRALRLDKVCCSWRRRFVVCVVVWIACGAVWCACNAESRPFQPFPALPSLAAPRFVTLTTTSTAATRW